MTLLRLLLAGIRREDNCVSDRWLRQYAQSQSRVRFEGPAWNWSVLIADMKRKRRHGMRRVERAA